MWRTGATSLYVSRVILLALIMLFGAVFLIVPESNNAPVFRLFPLNRAGEINVQTYMHDVFGHVQLMALSYMVAAESRIYRLSCIAFFWLQVADFLDYLANYNTLWFHLGLLPVSMNLLMPAVFGLVWIYELIKGDD